MSRPWTLRRRLTAVVGLIILVVTTSIAATVSLATRNSLIEEVDKTLLAFSTRPPVPNPPASSGESPTDPTESESFQPFAMIRFDRDGRIVIARPAGYADDPEPLPEVTQLTPADLAGKVGSFLTLGTVGDQGSVRALVVQRPEGLELLAQSLDSVDAATRRVVVMSLAISLTAAVAGIAVAWLLLRRGFRPVDDMIETAGAIAEGDLTRRIEPAESTTELGRLGIALDHMMARIESADRDRLREADRLRRFVDDASHELRTPIAAITGYAELYAEGGVEPGSQLDRAMGRINEAGQRAGRLIEDLLALARLDREIGSSQEQLDISELVEDTVEDARVGTGRDIRSDATGPVMVTGDPVWLRQAIENLINNAVTHAPTSTSIELVVQSRGDRGEIAVVDHGPGIAETERERVFDRFARPDAGRDRTHGGAGLGLAIVREVVLSHNGTVDISETPGGGTTVRISLPTTPPSVSAQP